jgi:hypothetical protein
MWIFLESKMSELWKIGKHLREAGRFYNTVKAAALELGFNGPFGMDEIQILLAHYPPQVMFNSKDLDLFSRAEKYTRENWHKGVQEYLLAQTIHLSKKAKESGDYITSIIHTNCPLGLEDKVMPFERATLLGFEKILISEDDRSRPLIFLDPIARALEKGYVVQVQNGYLLDERQLLRLVKEKKRALIAYAFVDTTK